MFKNLKNVSQKLEKCVQKLEKCVQKLEKCVQNGKIFNIFEKSLVISLKKGLE